MYKIYYATNLTAHKTYNSFKTCINYNTRNSANENYFLPQKQTNTGKIAFNYLGPMIWKEVPNDLKNCSYYAFKKR